MNDLNLTIFGDNASPFAIKVYSFYCRAIKEAFTNHVEESVPQPLLIPIVTMIFDSSIHLKHMSFLTGNPELNPTVRLKTNGSFQFLKLLRRNTAQLLASFLHKTSYIHHREMISGQGGWEDSVR